MPCFVGLKKLILPLLQPLIQNFALFFIFFQPTVTHLKYIEFASGVLILRIRFAKENMHKQTIIYGMM